jgi:hypothetical protein
VTDDDLLDVFRSTSDPVLSTAEVAEQVPIKRRGTLNRLQSLEEDGALERKQIGGRNTVWWLVGGERITPGERAVKEDAEKARTVRDRRREDTPEAPESDPVADPLEDVDFPGGRDRDECVAVVYAARDYIKNHGGATKQDLVENVMPDYPLGYDVDKALGKIDAGDRYRGSWWRKIVKPGLKALDDVQTPPQGASTWRFTGDVGEDSTAGGVYDPTEEF